MKGHILNIDGRWLIKTTFLLSDEDIEEIKKLEERFDNIEARIMSNPIVYFELKDGKAKLLDENEYPLLGVFTQNDIVFDSEIDKKIFFDALDQPDEPNRNLLIATEKYSILQYIKNKINDISLEKTQNDQCLLGKYMAYMEMIEFLNKTK